MQQGYILGVGTNVDSKRNALKIILELRLRFASVLVSQFYSTEPVGMSSKQTFINFCVFIETALEPRACKAVCAAIEVHLGRDRTHALSSTRDRPADIDLLTRIGADGSRLELGGVPAYLVAPAAEIVAMLWPT